VTIDTSGLSPEATRLANMLAQEIGRLDQETLHVLAATIEAAEKS
jgi:hypothetical protein